MGMTAAEKILARASGARAGARGRHRLSGARLRDDPRRRRDGREGGARRARHRPALRSRARDDGRPITTSSIMNDRAVARGAFNRKAARAWGVKQFYDAGRGGHGHIFPTERGLLLPGMFYFDNDRHCTNAGGIGALAIRVGAEIGRVLATGTTWTLVPQTVRVTIEGRLQPGVYGRDLGFHLGKLIRGARRRDRLPRARVRRRARPVQPRRAHRAVQHADRNARDRRVLPAFGGGARRTRASARRGRSRPVYPDADARYETRDRNRREPRSSRRSRCRAARTRPPTCRKSRARASTTRSSARAARACTTISRPRRGILKGPPRRARRAAARRARARKIRRSACTARACSTFSSRPAHSCCPPAAGRARAGAWDSSTAAKSRSAPRPRTPPAASARKTPTSTSAARRRSPHPPWQARSPIPARASYPRDHGNDRGREDARAEKRRGERRAGRRRLSRSPTSS